MASWSIADEGLPPPPVSLIVWQASLVPPKLDTDPVLTNPYQPRKWAAECEASLSGSRNCIGRLEMTRPIIIPRNSILLTEFPAVELVRSVFAASGSDLAAFEQVLTS